MTRLGAPPPGSGARIRRSSGRRGEAPLPLPLLSPVVAEIGGRCDADKRMPVDSWKCRTMCSDRRIVPLPPKMPGNIDAKAFDRLRWLHAISLRQNTDRVMDESGIDGYELEEPNGRGLGEADRGPILKRNIKRITRFMRRDSGQEKIV